MASNIPQTGAGISGPLAERNSVTPAVKQPPFYGFVKRATHRPARAYLAELVAEPAVWYEPFSVWVSVRDLEEFLLTEKELEVYAAWDREDREENYLTVGCAIAAAVATVVLDLMT